MLLDITPITGFIVVYCMRLYQFYLSSLIKLIINTNDVTKKPDIFLATVFLCLPIYMYIFHNFLTFNPDNSNGSLGGPRQISYGYTVSIGSRISLCHKWHDLTLYFVTARFSVWKLKFSESRDPVRHFSIINVPQIS